MGKRLAVDKSIGPELTKKILISLHHACVEASREVGRDMGFTIDYAKLVIEPMPDPVTSIDFEFSLTLKKG